MTFAEAVRALSRSERFRATVYAMNSLLLGKGIYTPEQFERLFCEHARNYRRCEVGPQSALLFLVTRVTDETSEFSTNFRKNW